MPAAAISSRSSMCRQCVVGAHTMLCTAHAGGGGGGDHEHTKANTAVLSLSGSSLSRSSPTLFIGACAECMTGQVAGQRLASAGSGRVSCVAASLAARPWFVNGPESAPLLRREPTHGDLVWARIWSAF